MVGEGAVLAGLGVVGVGGGKRGPAVSPSTSLREAIWGHRTVYYVGRGG